METQSLGRESGCSMLLSLCLCGLGSLETWSGLEFLNSDSDTFEEVVISMMALISILREGHESK